MNLNTPLGAITGRSSVGFREALFTDWTATFNHLVISSWSCSIWILFWHTANGIGTILTHSPAILTQSWWVEGRPAILWAERERRKIEGGWSPGDESMAGENWISLQSTDQQMVREAGQIWWSFLILSNFSFSTIKLNLGKDFLFF